MKLDQKRWAVLAASCFVNLCIGSLYAWSVFASPMASYLAEITGRQVTGISIVFTVANSVGPVTMITGGRINDRLGPRWAIFLGGLVFGGGMIASGFARSLLQLVVSYGLGCGLGMGLVYSCTVSNSVKFFPDHRGLAGGLTTASYGISAVLVPPVAAAMMGRWGITMTFRILGAVIMVIVCTAAFFIVRCPEGYQPAGWTGSAAAMSSRQGKDWRGMLRDPVFFVMLVILFSGAFAGLMSISQASAMAQKMAGMTPGAAAAAVSILALFNTAGRILSGYLADRIGSVSTLRAVFLFSTCGLLTLFAFGQGHTVPFLIGISVVGFGFGAVMGVFPGFTASQFGSEHNSVNYGILFIGFAAAGYFGPTTMTWILSRSGSYRPAFLTAAGLTLVGIAATLLYQGMEKRARSAPAR